MQFYRGMDIGTAKLPVEERRGIPHHLIDILDVTAEANVQDFQARARAAIADIRDRGQRPILVGGSGLYVRAAVDHMEFPAPTRKSAPGWRPRPQPTGGDCTGGCANSTRRLRRRSP
jgi:tRNA A37 N6-isopentenylltransferase MiaA